tara:strand:+ start:10784 stop:11848 length:1065 start_codon:yes stop_codon:yes gene_type:complete
MMSLRRSLFVLVAAPAFLLVACSGSDAAASGELSGSLSGTGASFPAPLYQAWFKMYHDEVNSGIKVNYDSQGSSKGVRAVIAGTHDFGASDAAMKDSELAEVDPQRGMLMLPMTAGAVVVAHNTDIQDLKLDRATLADIFLGKISRWNDPAIAATNAGTTLPNAKITVVRRSDGSGTTYAFTNHLSAISSEWQSKHGVSKSVNWFDGALGAKGNEGVTAGISQNKYSLGYVEFSYADKNNLQTAALQNKAGKFVKPTIASFQSALAGDPLPANMRLFVPDPAGDASFPIVTYTWILAYKNYDDANKVAILKDVLNWCLTEGQKHSEGQGYVPLPTTVTDKVRAAVNTIKVTANG